MTGSAPGHTSRSEEPHCYNCGASGHWVIACPEPTRETPAGLSAWKKSANAGHGHGRGKDQHHGGSRKAKGPIITKYAPPPPPGPPPAAGVGAPGAFYPPPPGAYYPPPAPLPGPLSYPPQYPPHPHPYPQAAPGYHPPAYQPQNYSQQNFPPPVTYGSHPAGQPSYPASIPPRPPPPATLPPRYPPYPPPRSDTHSYGPPASHPPARPPQHPPSFAQASTHRQPRPSYSPPPGRASAPAHPTAPPPRSLPPPPLSLPEGLHHSLPPKPPKVVRENQESQRGNRHKRKHDRQNRHRDGRNKDMSGQRGPNKSQQPSDHQGGHRKSQASIDAPASLPQKVETAKPHNKAQSETLSSSSGSPKGAPAKSVEEVQPSSESGQPPVSNDADLDELEDWDWELATIFNVAEPPSGPDEVGVPLPEAYAEDVLLPRKWDAKCLVSKYIKPDNMEDFIKPIHDTVSWLKFEFDPAFLRAGQFPSGEPLSEYMEQIKSFDFGSLARSQMSNKEEGDQLLKADSPSNDTLGAHPQESPATVVETTTHSDIEALDGTPEQEAQNHHEERDAGMSQNSPSLPRTRIRKRSRERRRSPKPSRDSRRSSVSSQSSDLSSLEAELLGRPPKRKRQSDIPRRRRLDTHSRQQPGRWPSVASSAYSRRW